MAGDASLQRSFLFQLRLSRTDHSNAINVSWHRRISRIKTAASTTARFELQAALKDQYLSGLGVGNYMRQSVRISAFSVCPSFPRNLLQLISHSPNLRLLALQQYPHSDS